MEAVVLVISTGALVVSSVAVAACVVTLLAFKNWKREMLHSLCVLKASQEKHNREVAETACKAKNLLATISTFDIEEVKKAIMEAVQQRVDQKIKDIAN